MNDAVRVDLERYLSDAMSPGERQQFLDGVRRDPDALALLGRSLEDQAYLYDALHVATEPRSAHDTSRILRVSRRLGSRPGAAGGPALAWILGAVAAGIVIVLVLFSSTTPRPKLVAKQPAVRVVEIPAPAPAPELAPKPVPLPAPVVKVETPPPPPPLPSPEPPLVEFPKPPDPKPAPSPTLVMPADKTVVAIGRVEQGAAAVPLVSGMAVEGPALVRFNDGTKLDVATNTVIREIVEDAGGKRVMLTSGSLTSDIAKQPAGKPLLFATPQAVAKVVGTVLRLTVDAKSTRLEVREGKVNLKRTSDNKAVDVAAGFTADSADLAVKPSPVDDILLAPLRGEIGGGEWTAVQDPAALGGVALEALRTVNRQPFKQAADAARVTWTFRADAGRDYYVWARGLTLAKTDAFKRDAVALEFVDSKVTEREGPSKGNAGGGDRALYNGYMHQAGYWWVGGDADGANDEVPVVVRFNRPGLQTVRLYALETPVRIDAIWISATQKTRPDAQGGPAAERK